MRNRQLSYLFFFILFSPGIHSQPWVELNTYEKKMAMESLNRMNQGEGCYDLTYTMYNFSKKSTPTKIQYGVQCKNGSQSVINVSGEYLIFANAQTIVQVDSAQKLLVVSYNVAQMNLTDRSDEIRDVIIENSGLVFKRKLKANTLEYKIQSIENNGIDHYILRVDAENIMSKYEIFYSQIADVRYNQDPEISQPILVIDYSQNLESEYRKMLALDYFLSIKDSVATPSANYADYAVYDARILPNQE